MHREKREVRGKWILKNGDTMKSIHYDAEGDILSVIFAQKGQTHTGIELSDNIVLYYNPETQEPIELMMLSYRAILHASTQSPLLFDGLTQMPIQVQAMVTLMLQRAPLTSFFHLLETSDTVQSFGQLHEIFTPSMWQTVAAG